MDGQELLFTWQWAWHQVQQCHCTAVQHRWMFLWFHVSLCVVIPLAWLGLRPAHGNVPVLGASLPVLEDGSPGTSALA